MKSVKVKFIHDWKEFKAGKHNDVGMNLDLALILEESGVVIIKKKEQPLTTIAAALDEEE